MLMCVLVCSRAHVCVCVCVCVSRRHPLFADDAACERSLRRRTPVPESNLYKRLKVTAHIRHCDFNCGASALGPERLLLDRVKCIGYFRLLTTGRLTAFCYSTFTNHPPFRTSSPLHSFPEAPLFCRHPNVQNTIPPN